MHVSEKGKYRAQMYEWNGHDWNDYVAAVHLRLSLLRHHQWPVSERRQTQTNNKLKIGREREREKESGMLEHRSIPEPSQTRAAPLGFKGSGGSLLQIPFCAWHKHPAQSSLQLPWSQRVIDSAQDRRKGKSKYLRRPTSGRGLGRASICSLYTYYIYMYKYVYYIMHICVCACVYMYPCIQ